MHSTTPRLVRFVVVPLVVLAACGGPLPESETDDVVGLSSATSPLSGNPNVALGKSATANSTYSSFTPDKAVDGSTANSSAWCSRLPNDTAFLELDLGGTFTLSDARVTTGQGSSLAIRAFDVQYQNGSTWQPIPGAARSGLAATDTVVELAFSTSVEASRLRFLRLDTTPENCRLREFEVFGVPSSPPVGNTPPLVEAGNNRSVALPVTSVTLQATASDADGTVSSFAWSKESGPSVTLGAVNAASLTLTNLVAGTYVFRVVVTDDDGAQASDTVTVVAAPLQPGTLTKKLAGTTGAPYGHVEYLPARYVAEPTATDFPLIIFLSGVGEKGDGSSTGLDKIYKHGPIKLAKANTRHFDAVILAPQSGNGFFNFNSVDALVTYALTTYRVDPKRVYLTGLSAGAISGWDYLARFPSRVAAAALIAGNGNGPWASFGCALAQTPIWAFHGELDTNVNGVNVGGSINPVKNINATCNPVERAKVTIYLGVGHDSWTRTYDGSGRTSAQSPLYDPFTLNDDVFDWLTAHRRP